MQAPAVHCFWYSTFKGQYFEVGCMYKPTTFHKPYRRKWGNWDFAVVSNLFFGTKHWNSKFENIEILRGARWWAGWNIGWCKITPSHHKRGQVKVKKEVRIVGFYLLLKWITRYCNIGIFDHNIEILQYCQDWILWYMKIGILKSHNIEMLSRAGRMSREHIVRWLDIGWLNLRI